MLTSITGLRGAYISVCGILCSGQCSSMNEVMSSMQQSLEMRACLKLNQKVLCASGFAL